MKGKRGYTLIELVVAIALVAAVSLLMFAIFGQGVNLYAKETNSVIEQTNLRIVLSDITNIARLTKPDNISYSAGILNIGSNFYTFNNQTVKKNGIVIAKDIASFDVSISGGILDITIVSISDKSISTSISLLG